MRQKLAQPVDDIIHWTQGLLDSVYGSVTVLQVRQELSLLLLDLETVRAAVDRLADALLVPDVRRGIAYAHQCSTSMSRLIYVTVPLFNERYGDRLTELHLRVLGQIDRSARLMLGRMEQVKAYLGTISDRHTPTGRYLYLPTLLRQIAAGEPSATVGDDDAVDMLKIAARVGEVYADPLAIRTVLAALLDNAWQFAPYGEVSIHAIQPDAHTVTVRVQDQGRGVPLIHCERIFEPFYQIDPTRIGLGLGLTIADATVRAWGGTLTLDTSPRQETLSGATFVFTLPTGPSRLNP